MIKKFERFDNDKKSFHPGWQDDFLYIYDLFCELEDSKIGHVDFQAGIFYTSNGSKSYYCFLRDGDIFGHEDSIDLADNGKVLFRVSINCYFKHGNYSPFRPQYGTSYFGENADLLLKIMSMVSSIKNRTTNYNVDITMDGSYVNIHFLSK